MIEPGLPLTVTTGLGILFLLLAAAATLLMYRLWAYPFDHASLTSSAPPRLMRLHRALGLSYGAIYVVLMAEMLPRLLQYQIELPPRTVAHVVIGVTIGAILVAKICIVRWFKHLESALAPALGTALFVLTIPLLALSLPSALQTWFRSGDPGRHDALSADARGRLAARLASLGLPAGVEPGQLAAPANLRRGRQVLLRQCVQCHDLRTVLMKPRTPDAWWQTVNRMADRAGGVVAIDDDERLAVTAYLIALSPDLQRGLKQRRREDERADRTRRALGIALANPSRAPDPERLRPVFEATCSQCHGLDQIDGNPPRGRAEAEALVARMVGNGLAAEAEVLADVIDYLALRFPEPGASGDG